MTHFLDEIVRAWKLDAIQLRKWRKQQLPKVQVQMIGPYTKDDVRVVLRLGELTDEEYNAYPGYEESFRIPNPGISK